MLPVKTKRMKAKIALPLLGFLSSFLRRETLFFRSQKSLSRRNFNLPFWKVNIIFLIGKLFELMVH